MTGSRRRWRRAAGIGLAAGLALAVVWMTGGQVLLRQLNRATGLAIEARRARITFRPAGLWLHEVRIAAEPGGAAILTAGELRVDAPLGGLLSGVARVREIALARVRLHVQRVPGGGGSHRVDPLGLPPAATLHTDRVLVDGAVIDLPAGGGPRRLRLRALRLARLTIARGAVRLRGEALLAGARTGHLRGRYRASAARGTRAALEVAHADLRALDIVAGGTRLRSGFLYAAVRYVAGRDDVGDAGLRGRLTVRALRARSGAIRVAAGRVDVRRLAADPVRATARAGLVAAERVRVSGETFPALRLRALVAPSPRSGTRERCSPPAAGRRARARRRHDRSVQPDAARSAEGGRRRARAAGRRGHERGRYRAGPGVGRLALAWPPLTAGRGAAVIEPLRVAVGAEPAAAARRLAIRFDHATLRPLRVQLDDVELDGPWLRLRRGRDGLHPIAALEHAFASPAWRPYLVVRPGDAASEPVAAGDLEVSVRDGILVFEDRVVEPPVDLALGDVALAVRHRRTAPGSVIDGWAVGVLDGAVVSVDGHADGRSKQVTATVRDVDLSALRSYVASATGYVPTAGSLTLASRVDMRRSGFDTTTNLVLDRVALERAGGDEFFGAPLERLIGLAGDRDGRIELSLNVTGEGFAVDDDVGPRSLAGLRDALTARIAAPLLTRATPSGGEARRRSGSRRCRFRRARRRLPGRRSRMPIASRSCCTGVPT